MCLEPLISNHGLDCPLAWSCHCNPFFHANCLQAWLIHNKSCSTCQQAVFSIRPTSKIDFITLPHAAATAAAAARGRDTDELLGIDETVDKEAEQEDASQPDSTTTTITTPMSS